MPQNTYSGAVTDTATAAQGVSAIGQLGALRYEPDGRIYRCVKAADLLVANRMVAYSGDPSAWTVTATTATSGLAAGAAVSAIPASGFGWIQVHGEAEVAPGAAVTAGANISITGTAGKVDDITPVLNPVGVAIDAATGDVTPALITCWISLL